MDLGSHFLDVCVQRLQGLKRLAEGATFQLDGGQMHAVSHEGANSVVVQMKHLAGNMVSRWTDFLTTDGEKPDRNRDGEFVDDFTSREQLDATWEHGWAVLFETLAGLTPDSLLATVTIRAEGHTVLDAIQRQVAHYAYHVGQIVQRARDLKGADWVSLSIPRGQSGDSNRRTRDETGRR